MDERTYKTLWRVAKEPTPFLLRDHVMEAINAIGARNSVRW